MSPISREEGKSRYRRILRHQKGRIRKETLPQHITNKTINTQNKEKY
jgi:hypothetical protein